MRIDKQFWFWLGALALVVLAIALLKDILLPFVAAIVIAYFLSPLADRLQALGIGRMLAALIVVGALAVIVALAIILLVPVLAEQVRQLIAAAPSEIEKARVSVETLARYWLGPNFPAFKTALDRAMGEASDNWATLAGGVMASMWTRGLAVVNFVALVLITPVVVFYLLVDWHAMMARVDSVLPRDHAPTVRRLAGDINDAVAAFIRGQGAICILLGIYYAAGLSWAGIDYGLLVGLTTGLLAFIPIAGWLLGTIFASGLAIVQFWPDFTPLAKVVGVMVTGIAFDAAVLSPRFVGQKVGLHPVWLIFALFVFSYLFGFVGTLVAVPLAAAVGVLVRFALQVYLDSPVYKGATETPAVGVGPPSKDVQA